MEALSGQSAGMPTSRHFIAAGLSGLVLAFGAAACDNEEDRPNTDDSPVNTDTPQGNVDTTPAPAGSDPEVRTTRTDGE